MWPQMTNSGCLICTIARMRSHAVRVVIGILVVAIAVVGAHGLMTFQRDVSDSNIVAFIGRASVQYWRERGSAPRSFQDLVGSGIVIISADGKSVECAGIGGMYNGFDPAVFATLSIDYSRTDQQGRIRVVDAEPGLSTGRLTRQAQDRAMQLWQEVAANSTIP